MKMNGVTLIALCAAVMLSAGNSLKAGAKITPEQLTCEDLVNPAVMDASQPRLSWINNAGKSCGATQSAWQIRVASSEKGLNQADLWDSGKQSGDQSYLIPYGGRALRSGETCWWQVRVWNGDDKPSAWSRPACWTMGMLAPTDWKCTWIGTPWQDDMPIDKSKDKTPPPAPLLRKEFTIDPAKKVASAHFFGTGLGYFELYFNGKKVSDDVLVPAQTNYSKRPGLSDRQISIPDNFREYRVMYLGYDLTSLLHKGTNAVGAILGNGFYNSNIHWTTGYGSPRFFGQIIITYTDGSQQIVGSDATWKVSKSAILSDMIYAGEHYDARKEQSGWSNVGFDDSKWQAAALRQAPGGKMVAQNAPTDRVMEVLKPVKIDTLGKGHYRIDFGEEISGWVHLHSLQGKAGNTIQIKYLSESPNGANSYTMNGSGDESYHTRFTWYVFRSVEVEGWPGTLREGQITAEAVNTALPTTGEFECSNDLFNKINRIWWRSQSDNMHGAIASDCPHRERSSYTGDGQISCVTVMHNFNAASFYRKWIRDIWGSQNVETGYVPNGAPWQPGCGGGPAWGAAMNIMPWEYYQHYGDKKMLTDNYDAMKAQVEFMLKWVDNDGVMNMTDANEWKTLGDWCPPYEMPRKDMVHTFFLWRCADYTARAAHALGNTKDEATYRALADRTAAAFHKRFYDAEKGTYGRFGGNIFALRIGVPADRYAKVIASLKQDILNNGGHLDTAVMGTQFFFEVLAENGLQELAYEAMNKRDFPSFGNWIEQGATTTWEQWDGGNSHNHPFFGGSLTWFYRKLAGMNADPDAPGYRHIIFRPQPAEAIDWVRYGTVTPYGPAGISWSKQLGNLFVVTLRVPVGSTATLYLPGITSPDVVGIDNKDPKLVRFTGIENGSAAYAVQSGIYTFTVMSGSSK